MPQQVYQHTFPNGLTLLLERMDHVRSAAVNFLVPAGCVYDPPDQLGVASIFSEMITRGAGDRDSRALTHAMDSLGLDHSESVGQLHLRFWGSTLARNILPALELFAKLREQAKEAGVPLRLLYAEARDIPDAILDMAVTHGSDLLLLGTTRRGALWKAMKGDVIQAVAEHLPESVGLLIHA